MTFEEQLTHAFETLTERLRGALDLEVQRVTADLVAAAQRDRGAFADPSSTGAPDRAGAAAPREPHHAGGGADMAAGPRLADAVRSLDRARSLTEILDTLVACARTASAHADVWLIRGGRLHEWRSSGSDLTAADRPPSRPLDEGGAMEAVRTNAVVSADGTIAVPLAIAGQVVAVVIADAGEPNLEFLARYAARCMEALTAFKTARALTERADEPDAATGSPPAADAADNEDEASARRYARLLVSEIKLYHESAVIEGRRDRDLATRLGGEIARARAMYEDRVAPHVRQHADYFFDELVRTLANGDAGLLEPKT